MTLKVLFILTFVISVLASISSREEEVVQFCARICLFDYWLCRELEQIFNKCSRHAFALLNILVRLCEVKEPDVLSGEAKRVNCLVT